MNDTAPKYPFGPVPPDEAVMRYQQIQRDRPMTRVTYKYGGDAWVVHRHEAAKQIVKDSRLVRQPFLHRDVPYFVRFPDFLKTTLQFEDPPEHTRHRRLVAKAFTAKRVEALRPSVEQLAANLLDGLEAHGAPANLVSDYAMPLSIQVLSDLLGVSVADRDKFERWAHALLATSGMTPEEIAQSFSELQNYMADLIADRRQSPTDDLLSGLASAREQDDSLTDDEILSLAMLLIVGGFDNTANFIAAGTVALLNSPAQLQILLADVDGVIPTAVEEILRHAMFCQGQNVVGGGGLVPFIATADIDVDGMTIKAGEAVHIDSTAANHDGTVYQRAEAFDVRRDPNPQLTLNHGPHLCLGAPLARLELQVAIGSLFHRFPNLELAGTPQQAHGLVTGGMTTLPVRW